MKAPISAQEEVLQPDPVNLPELHHTHPTAGLACLETPSQLNYQHIHSIDLDMAISY